MTAVIDLSRPSESPPVPTPAEPDRLWRERLARFGPPLILVVVAAVLFGHQLNGYPEYINDDEGTYFAQSWAVVHEHVMAHYTYWYDHPPLGWIQLAFFIEPIQWIFGTGDESIVTSGRRVVAGYMIVAALLLYKIARNLGMPRVAALGVGLLWVLCPTSVYYGRQIFLDNFAMVWVLAAFALITGRQRLHYYVLAGLAFGIAVLSKETAAVAVIGLLYALWTYCWKETRAFALTGFIGTTAFVGSGYVLFAIVKNELFPGPGHVSLGTALAWQLGGRVDNGFLFTPGTDANSLLHEWLDHDFYLLAFGMAAAIVCLLFTSIRGAALIPVIYLLTTMRGGYIPRMHIITPLPFMALCLGFLVWKAWQHSHRFSLRPVVLGARAGLVLLMAASAIVVAPHWAKTDEIVFKGGQNEAYMQMLGYVRDNLPRDSRILTDDNTWNDLVALGWTGDRWDGPVWHFKLDRDSEAREHLPNGWRDVQYIIAGRGLQALMNTVNISWSSSPEVVSAMQNSALMAQFGSPDANVTVRKVQPEGDQGCVKWSCPVEEPSWTSATGIGGSEEKRALGRLLAIQQGTTPSPPPGEAVPVDPTVVTGP
jgi:hypothetical protein